jgi:hypothetical protein
MNYYKYVGTRRYDLLDELNAYANVIVCIVDSPTWTLTPDWKQLSKVELLIELHKHTPVFKYDNKKCKWIKVEL